MAANLRMRVRRVNLDLAKLVEPGGVVYEATDRAGKRAVELAQKEAPKRTGRLRDSIEYRIVTDGTKVIADVGPGRGALGVGTPPQEYAKFVIFGTDSPIEPVSGDVLVIRDGGPKYHTKVSGQKANPFLQRALKQVRKEIFEP